MYAGRLGLPAAAALAALAALAPASQAQIADTDPSLGVRLGSQAPHHYKAEDGRTVVVGQAHSSLDFPVSGVKIWAGFYGEAGGEPLETAVGTTLLEVVPPGGSVPYAIRSPTANAAISGVTLNVLGFNYADEKPAVLRLEASSPPSVAEALTFSGTVGAEPPAAAGNVTLHMLMYDAFDPPRIIWASPPLEVAAPPGGGPAPFSFRVERLPRADGFYVVAESGAYVSEALDVEAAPAGLASRRVAIDDVRLRDAEGNAAAGATSGEPVEIGATAWLQGDVPEGGQDYVYYAQVKRAGEGAVVEHIARYEGSFSGPAAQEPSARWTPAEAGLYFVETFVWDPDGVPLASKGPIVLVLVG